VTRNPLIRVLVIDDSAFSRQVLTRMLSKSPLVEVVGVARDGEDALKKTLELKPDLITLDLEMPRMDGFTFLRIVMAKRPTPVMVISGRVGQESVFRALELGAVDFLAKPTPRAGEEFADIERELIRKVHAIRELRIEKVSERISTLPTPAAISAPSEGPHVVAIGCSTGGPAALMQVFGAFTEAPACAFVVAQHMPSGFTRSFAERVDRLTPLRALEARGGEALLDGTVLIAPGGSHLELAAGLGQVVTRVVRGEPRDKYTPSVDRLFESAAKHLGRDLTALVLTGMGDDGRRGALAVRDAGGVVLAESEETAVIFGMPQQVIRAGVVDRVLPLHEIAATLQGGLEALRAQGGVARQGRRGGKR
jgi:two-component system chemotaxis response regulator CheB